jgi:hypothetical protein
MNNTNDRITRARRVAEALLDPNKQFEREALKAKEKKREAEASKTARLRELRLAKEAAEKEAGPRQPSRPRRGS